jgi:beta-lactam-binding protein with PASTA domain
VTLKVSAGEGAQYVTMENFVGGRLFDAVKFLEENGVKYEIAVSTDKTADIATVVSQSVAAGEKTVKYLDIGKVILTVGALANE